MTASRGSGGAPLHIAGTGSFALEVVEFAAAAGFAVVALVELMDPARVGGEIHGLPVVAAVPRPTPEARAVLGAGGDRRALWAPLAAAGWGAATVVHPVAHVSDSARLGAGTVVGPMAVVGAASDLGAHALVGRGALIGHHVAAGEGVVLNPGANVAGHVRLGDGAVIGMGAQIADHVTIGAGAVVAAGAVVVRDVEPGTRVQGVPARRFERA